MSLRIRGRYLRYCTTGFEADRATADHDREQRKRKDLPSRVPAGSPLRWSKPKVAAPASAAYTARRRRRTRRPTLFRATARHSPSTGSARRSSYRPRLSSCPVPSITDPARPSMPALPRALGLFAPPHRGPPAVPWRRRHRSFGKFCSNSERAVVTVSGQRRALAYGRLARSRHRYIRPAAAWVAAAASRRGGLGLCIVAAAARSSTSCATPAAITAMTLAAQRRGEREDGQGDEKARLAPNRSPSQPDAGMNTAG